MQNLDDAPDFDFPDDDAPQFDFFGGDGRISDFEQLVLNEPEQSQFSGPGIYYGMSKNVYHSGPGISKSGLDYIANNPSDYEWLKSAPVDNSKTLTLDNGSFFHCLIGEPGEIAKVFAKAPDVNLRTNAGKAELAEFKLTNADKIIVSDDDWLRMHMMRDSALAHPTVRMIMEAEGVNESSIFWIDDETGELCKISPDRLIWLGGQPIIIDWKTVAGLDRFSANAEEHRYHVQDAMYRDGVKKHFGLDVLPQFWFVPISSSINCGRYPVTVTQLPEDWYRAGFDLYRRDLTEYHRCRTENDWLHVSTMQRPRWAR